MTDSLPNSEFIGGDFSDERKLGDWKTRYPEKEAKRAIVLEAVYTAALLFICPISLFVIWLVKCNHIDLSMQKNQCALFCRYAYAWFGGLFGGTIYTMKWLYHSVAHGQWNIDRRFWRYLSPHLSAALAVAFIWMIDSELLSVFDGQAVEKTPVVLSCSFLVGYFSDRAVAKMSDIANVLFGVSKKASNSSKN